MIKHYIVDIKIQAGEYEKHTNYMVIDTDNTDTNNISLYACLMESHSPELCTTKECHIIDLGYEFAYTGSSTLITENEFNVMKKYIGYSYFNQDDINNTPTY